MILLIDIGNSRIKIGLCKNPNIRNDINVFYCENINKINSELEKIDNYGFDGDYIESQAFAYLAIRSYLNLPISFPNTTKCKKPTLGGEVNKNF